MRTSLVWSQRVTTLSEGLASHAGRGYPNDPKSLQLCHTPHCHSLSNQEYTIAERARRQLSMAPKWHVVVIVGAVRPRRATVVPSPTLLASSRTLHYNLHPSQPINHSLPALLLLRVSFVRHHLSRVALAAPPRSRRLPWRGPGRGAFASCSPP